MASTQGFSATQATWERTGEGDQSWRAGGSAPSPPQDHFLLPAPPWPLEQDTDMPHLPTAVGPLAGHLL